MNKRKIGDEKEAQVCLLLEKYGYRIIERNYRVRQGEIDIVAKKDEYLVFVEVKYRSTEYSGEAAMAVNYQKQKQISKVALYYLKDKKISENQAIRFDVVTIDDRKVKIIPNAFDFIY